MHRVPRTALWTPPVPAYAVQSALIALISATAVADACQQGAQRCGISRRLHVGSQLSGNPRQAPHVLRWQSRSQQPDELPRADPARALQPLRELTEHVGLTDLFGQRQD